MTLEALLLFLAAGLEFYGAWSIDFAWHGRETEGTVGLPFPRRPVHVSARFWWWQAWIAMIAGVGLLFLVIMPEASLIWMGGAFLAVSGLLFVWYTWYRGRGVLGGGHAATWNVAFFFGVFGGSILMILGT
ncbi:MAG: hypothetical protein ACE5JE_02185 [Thermoplasmata archaeon]